ncbi:MAG: hypothetical protein J6I68_14450 [Butyrivibrio sp.]|uniref:hypothetical protein n=1 Tax=Butyrivibrio sp. TaxID=28121 RepID=UPI001B4D1EA5|nr:hypothetical protein [Butyrivibrio sp.]MBP3784442.1 hypothetical protein [Butyrivibrio sp.]
MAGSSNRKVNSLVGCIGIIAVVFTMLFSAYFLAGNMRHICCTHQRAESGCPICTQIEECQSIMQRTSAKVFTLVAFLNVVAAVKAVAIFSEIFINSTLVTQKVRIDR